MPHLLKVGILTPEVRITRPSALGMWDPICGPLIHNLWSDSRWLLNKINLIATFKRLHGNVQLIIIAFHALK